MAKILTEVEEARLRNLYEEEKLKLSLDNNVDVDPAESLIAKASAAGMQYSKAAKTYLRSLYAEETKKKEEKIIKPTIVGDGNTDDSQKIGESNSVQGIKVEHADNTKEQKAEPARKRFKLEEAFSMEKGADGKTKMSFKLPSSEEEFEDLFTDIAPRIKNNGVKGVVNAVGHTLATGLRAGINNRITNTFEKCSDDYRETGKLNEKEQAFAKSMNNMVDVLFRNLGF